MNKNRLLGVIGLFGTGLVGGAFLPSLIRAGTELFHPFVLNWLRVFLGLSLALILFRGKYNLRHLFHKKYLHLYVIMGLGISLNTSLFSFGLQYTTLVASQLIYVLVPVITSTLLFVFFKQHTDFKKIVGMGLALLGVSLLIIFSRSPEQRMSLGSFYGNILIAFAAISYSHYLIFSKKLSTVYSVVEMVIISNLLSSFILLPLAAFEAARHPITQVSPLAILLLLALAASGLLFFYFSQLSIKHLSAQSASLSSILTPQFAAMVGIIFYQEQLSLILLISIILSSSGIILSVKAEPVSFKERLQALISKVKHSL
jgi:drug/metabolite transporter (DMT)-like permease